MIGNVQWIHKDVNRLKMQLEEKDFINYRHRISEFQKAKNENL